MSHVFLDFLLKSLILTNIFESSNDANKIVSMIHFKAVVLRKTRKIILFTQTVSNNSTHRYTGLKEVLFQDKIFKSRQKDKNLYQHKKRVSKIIQVNKSCLYSLTVSLVVLNKHFLHRDIMRTEKLCPFCLYPLFIQLISNSTSTSRFI